MDTVCDICIADGAIASSPDGNAACEPIDATDKYVVPGLADFNLHACRAGSAIGVPFGLVCAARGVTTACHTGTGGTVPTLHNAMKGKPDQA